ncbi:MAG: molybdopterin molybdotransferase MoeA, partial [Rectinema sp.]|nr:molybdopterin molybdotransferase MoeA [Rectinema sp.]
MRTNLHPDEALRLLKEAAASIKNHLGTETVPIEHALGRVLAQDLRASIDHPPFAKSAMDGYAYVREAPCEQYVVIDSVPAGVASLKKLAAGEAVRIMTGAPLPDGATGVQRIEWTAKAGRDENGRPLIRFSAREKIDNIIARGENLRAGEPLMTRRVLMPQDIGILAADGRAQVEVCRRVRVGILSTGDEIMPAGTPLTTAKIYDSNGPQLAAQAAAAGAEVLRFGIARDTEPALADILSQALEQCTVVVLSGGVSMGDFDLVPRVLEQLGVAP